MASLDRIPLLTLATSQDIRSGWDARGLKVPKRRGDQRNMITGYAEKVKTKMIKELQEKLEQGEKFSFISDEWTSCANKRYMAGMYLIQN